MTNQNKSDVISNLLQIGFVDDGSIPAETIKSFNNNTQGFMLMKFPSRVRLKLPNTNWKVTIGRDTTYFYQVINRSATNGNYFQTRNIEEIINFAKSLIT